MPRKKSYNSVNKESYDCRRDPIEFHNKKKDLSKATNKSTNKLATLKELFFALQIWKKESGRDKITKRELNAIKKDYYKEMNNPNKKPNKKKDTFKNKDKYNYTIEKDL